jgi:hypothetical protein
VQEVVPAGVHAQEQQPGLAGGAAGGGGDGGEQGAGVVAAAGLEVGLGAQQVGDGGPAVEGVAERGELGEAGGREVAAARDEAGGGAVGEGRQQHEGGRRRWRR